MSTGITQPSGWYDGMDREEYPLLSGQRVPRALLSDLSVSIQGSDAWIESFAVQSGNVSLVLADHQGILCAITQNHAEPHTEYEFYGDRCTAVVVFGQGITSIDFKSTDKIEIYPTTVHSTLNTQEIIGRSGLVRPSQPLSLTGGEDVQVRFGYMNDDPELPALFLGLDTSAVGFDVHEKYLGPCDRRPAMSNCQGDSPVRGINGVQSDCCDKLYIEFQGVDIKPIENACGVALVLDYDMTQACPERKIARIRNRTIEECDSAAQNFAPDDDLPLS